MRFKNTYGRENPDHSDAKILPRSQLNSTLSLKQYQFKIPDKYQRKGNLV